MKNNIYLNDKNQTRIFAEKIAEIAEIGDLITLNGNLGAGKTSFVQYFVNYLFGDLIEITSPTFNLFHIYDLDKLKICHFDLYRLKTKEEIYEIGLEYALDNSISLIEWPDIIMDILPSNRLDLYIDFGQDENSRVINFKGSAKWTKLLLEMNKL